MNLAGAGTFAIWVLWARQRLGLRGVGFGALITVYAAGGLLGTLLASRLKPGSDRPPCCAPACASRRPASWCWP
jgi:hypothetical protein